jgi:ribosomal protein S18 acetylase RimI-like enzyme
MVMVRPATLADAPAMGQVVVRAWQAAYRGQLPEDYLDGLRAEERAAYWDGVLRGEHGPGVILVAERDGEVVGFAAAGPSPDPQGAGELYAINVDPDHWGGGAGRALLGAGRRSRPGRRAGGGRPVGGHRSPGRAAPLGSRAGSSSGSAPNA